MLGPALWLSLAAQAGLPAIDATVTPTKPLAAPRASAPSSSTCDEPVLLVIDGPAQGFAAYLQALASGGLYQPLGGYELAGREPIEQLQNSGDNPAKAKSIIRFPCRENAVAFWKSKPQQEQFALLRAGGAVTASIYPELPLRSDLIGKVGDNSYSADFAPAAPPTR